MSLFYEYLSRSDSLGLRLYFECSPEQHCSLAEIHHTPHRLPNIECLSVGFIDYHRKNTF